MSVGAVTVWAFPAESGRKYDKCFTKVYKNMWPTGIN